MDNKELQQKNLKELTEIVSSERAKLRDLRFKGAGGAMRDTKAIMSTKKTIARALTALTAKKGVDTK